MAPRHSPPGHNAQIAERTAVRTLPEHDAHHCPAGDAIDLVAHKWTVHILFALQQASAPLRFRQLQWAVKPITQKALTARLRELERSGLIRREVFAEVPPRVEYCLTDLGKTLMPVLTSLSDWASNYGAALAENRRRVDTGEARSLADAS